MKVSGVNTPMSRKREHRVLLMVITMVIFYLLCWLPYGIMALLATFGTPGLVTVEASIVPSILAKTSTVINPVIYIFMNKQFYRCFRDLFNCDKPQRGSSLKSTSKVTKPVRPGRRTDNFTFVVASVGATAVPNQANPAEDGPLSADNARPAVVSLVAHYNG
ncbi:vertebrate ancient opsin-like protein [Labeo rohita]|uniref:Vertebrate ancient opsin-like protein n=1 Tax=Labeo rohita TaxID=84645 RepID=A0A498L4R8_LABRO|nr:vertebrate ancient opsin-like protein [Labeo rohita]